MAHKEKARPEGEPIPNIVCQDSAEFNQQLTDLQALRFKRSFGLAFETGLVIAALAFALAR
jgi:hypothetical protein